jgi:hypothetical protein
MVTLDEFLEVCVRHSHDDWIYTGSAARAVLLIDAGLKSGAYFKDVDVLSLEPGAGHTEVTEEGVLIDYTLQLIVLILSLQLRTI